MEQLYERMSLGEKKEVEIQVVKYTPEKLLEEAEKAAKDAEKALEKIL